MHSTYSAASTRGNAFCNRLRRGLVEVKDPPVEVKEMEVEDANVMGCARTSAHRTMERHLQKNEQFQLEIFELE